MIVSDRRPELNDALVPAFKTSKPEREVIVQALEDICDPEIPVLSITDLGILGDVRWVVEGDRELLEVVITPTYSGCPAMSNFAEDIEDLLHRYGVSHVRVKTQLAPAWTTDWLTQAGREKLKAYGIAPPVGVSSSKQSLMGELPSVECPHCGGRNTRQVSHHGSTACKALYQCDDCLEPFDYFKCI